MLFFFKKKYCYSLKIAFNVILIIFTQTLPTQFMSTFFKACMQVPLATDSYIPLRMGWYPGHG